MYSGYATTILSLRAKSSFCHPHAPLLGDSAADSAAGSEFLLHGLSINPRSLLYGYYSRQSSLIYWSPSRSLFSGHATAAVAGARYRRLALGGGDCIDLSSPCRPKRSSARKAQCTACCQCQRSYGGSFRDMIGLLAGASGCYREGFGVRSSRRDDCCDEYGYLEENLERDIEFRSCECEKERIRRARANRDEPRWTCQSCGFHNEESKRRKNGGGSSRDYDGERVYAAARKARKFRNYEDDISSDSTMETEYRHWDSRNNEKRKFQREVEGKEASSAHRRRVDYDSEEDETIKLREKRKGSQITRKSEVHDDDMKRASNLSSVLTSRKANRVKDLALSAKQHSEVDQRVVEQDKWEVEKRETKGASSKVSSHEMRRKYKEQNVSAQRNSRNESRESLRLSDQYEDDTRNTSSSKKFVSGRKMGKEESSIMKHGQVDQRMVERAELRTGREEYGHKEDEVFRHRESREGSKKSIRISEVHEDDVKNISSKQDIVDSRQVRREESSMTSLKQHTELDERVSESSRSRTNIENLKVIQEVQDSDLPWASHTKRRYEEAELKDREELSTFVELARERRTHQQEVDAADLKRHHESHTTVSGVNMSGNEIARSSQGLLNARLDNREDYAISTLDLAHKGSVEEKLTDRQLTQPSNSIRESEMYTRPSKSSLENESISNTQIVLSTNIKNELNVHQYTSNRISEGDSSSFDYTRSNVQSEPSLHDLENLQLSSSLFTTEDKRNSSLLLPEDKKQKQKQETLYGERSTLRKTEIASTGASSNGLSSTYKHIQGMDDHGDRDKMDLRGGDMLESASRLEHSSAMYVEEFVDKLQQETSQISPEIQTDERHSGSTQITTLAMNPHDTTKYNNVHSFKEGARASSSRSGVKGPSDEMWDVRTPVSHEISLIEQSEGDPAGTKLVDSATATPTAEDAPIQRSPKSLWAFIGNVIRMGWGHRADSHLSTRKSGKRTSSSESVGSEAWFSGQELDASDDETDRGRTSMPTESFLLKVPVDQPQNKAYTSDSQRSSKLPKLGNTVNRSEGGTSTSMSMIQGGPVFTKAPTVLRLEGVVNVDGEKGTESTPSSEITVGESPLTGGAASAANQEVTDTTDVPVTASGFAVLAGSSIGGLPEVEKIEGKDGELKRRKFQRANQVIKERFEEWEEAYKLESEQRKIDEYFMREALLEAQKAADTWEVPVGAVLVQNGNIIARGFNLVEEQRDSTAHAEIICIREASNLLRTWRLADTTLYVTLEPCPMCAGAILQARIDTVVWGAPNKLLGADGSWVRLFPNGDGGSSSLDPSKQSTGPVHPFHPKITIRRGILEMECSEIMQQFFTLRRKNKKKRESRPPSRLSVASHPLKFFTKMHNIFAIMFCL